MKRQFAKGASILLVAVALAFVAAASTNAQSRLSRSEVPFDFVANNQTMPAGSYDIADLTGGHAVVKISNVRRAKAVFAMTTSLSRKGDIEKGKLVFHRYGNRYFLAEIWAAGDREGQKLRKSKEEKAIENEMAAVSSKTGLPQRTYERVEIALLGN